MNDVYCEISDALGRETALEVYRLYKGQQISFPVHFYNIEKIRKCVADEYDGTNIRALARKYGYSEKTIRRLIKEGEPEKK